jgi:hypothetical protein
MAMMTNQRIAKHRFQEARALFVNELTSTRQAVNLLAVAFTETFKGLENGCDRATVLQQAMLRAKDQDDIAKLVAEGSAIAADFDAAWRLLPQGIIALSYALVDTERLTNGKLQHLRLSSVERAALVSRITREYPNAARGGGGHAIDVSASVLLKFLKGAHNSSDQK